MEKRRETQIPVKYLFRIKNKVCQGWPLAQPGFMLLRYEAILKKGES
jgi:hypothetical protein